MKKETMETAVREVKEGAILSEVARKYGLQKGTLSKAVKKAKDKETVTDGNAMETVQETPQAETMETASPLLQEKEGCEGKSGTSEYSSQLSATIEPLGVEIVATSILGDDAIKQTSVCGIVSELGPVGASADSSLELEKLRAEIARLRSDNQVLSDAMTELEKLALAPLPASTNGETYGCGINPHLFRKGNSPACEACQIEIEFFVERVDKILHQVFEPRPVSPEERLEKYKQGLKDWHRLSVEMDLKSEFFEQQDPATIAERNKMKGAEQVRLDAIDFKQWLIDVKFKGTTEDAVMEMMGSWFQDEGREPAVSPSLN